MPPDSPFPQPCEPPPTCKPNKRCVVGSQATSSHRHCKDRPSSLEGNQVSSWFSWQQALFGPPSSSPPCHSMHPPPTLHSCSLALPQSLSFNHVNKEENKNTGSLGVLSALEHLSAHAPADVMRYLCTPCSPLDEIRTAQTCVTGPIWLRKLSFMLSSKSLCFGCKWFRY